MKKWLVQFPGTTKLHRLQENLGGAEVELTPEELKAIHDASPQSGFKETDILLNSRVSLTGGRRMRDRWTAAPPYRPEIDGAV